MRIVIAPDKFKGCLSARQVAAAIAQGIRETAPAATIDPIPLADGGEGTVDALVAATGGHLFTRQVTGPLPGTTVNATFGLLGDNQTAVIEMAAASGLHLLRPNQYNPEATTTYGTGELITAAFEHATQIILGIGGSATTDGGAGCAQACGIDFQMTDGTIRTRNDPPLTGANLPNIARVLTTSEISAKHFPPVRVACDVDNPLFGPRGAARIFGPQKGATPQQVDRLDNALQRFAAISNAHNLAQSPGAGAAGGLGFGLMTFLHARLEPGFQIIADAVHLADRMKDADLVITGEGRLDASSLGGKTAIGVARLAKQLNIPCVALVGSATKDADLALTQGLKAYHVISPPSMPLEESMRRAPEFLSTTAAHLMQRAFHP